MIDTKVRKAFERGKVIRNIEARTITNQNKTICVYFAFYTLVDFLANMAEDTVNERCCCAVASIADVETSILIQTNSLDSIRGLVV